MMSNQQRVLVALLKSSQNKFQLKNLNKNFLVAARCKQAKSFHTTTFAKFHSSLQSQDQEKKNKRMFEEEGEEEEVPKKEGFVEDFIRRGLLSVIRTPGVVEVQDLRRMWFYSIQMYIYKSFYDKEFDEAEFLEGAKKACEVVRPLIISKNWESVERMLDPVCLEAIKYRFATMEEQGVQIHGEFGNVVSAKIWSLRMREIDGRLETVINVEFVINELLSASKDGKVLIGSETMKQSLILWSFVREGLDSSWKVRSFMR